MRLPSPSAKNHILNTWCTIWATCHFTLPSRHSDSTETVLRRPCRLKAGDDIFLSTATSSFYCYSIVIFPSCPFLDMWNTWSLSPRQAQTWGKTGKILMTMKRKKYQRHYLNTVTLINITSMAAKRVQEHSLALCRPADCVRRVCLISVQTWKTFTFTNVACFLTLLLI